MLCWTITPFNNVPFQPQKPSNPSHDITQHNKQQFLCNDKIQRDKQPFLCTKYLPRGQNSRQPRNPKD